MSYHQRECAIKRSIKLTFSTQHLRSFVQRVVLKLLEKLLETSLPPDFSWCSPTTFSDILIA
eukprot:2029095-Rhodomonas_salina.3